MESADTQTGGERGSCRRGNKCEKFGALFAQRASDCQKTLLRGSEGRSPPSEIRIQRHARWIRKACVARFPCTLPRPRRRRRGNVFWRKRPPQEDFFDTLCGPGNRPAFTEEAWITHFIMCRSSLTRLWNGWRPGPTASIWTARWAAAATARAFCAFPAARRGCTASTATVRPLPPPRRGSGPIPAFRRFTATFTMQRRCSARRARHPLPARWWIWG